jgi:thioredoxin 1
MNKYTEIIKSDTPTLVDFHATWCGPCKMMIPILEQLKKRKGSSLRILKIDVDKNQQLATKLGIRGVPTLLYYTSGKMIWRKSGFFPLDELEKLIT